MKEVVKTLNFIDGNPNPDPGMIAGYSPDPDHSMMQEEVLTPEPGLLHDEEDGPDHDLFIIRETFLNLTLALYREMARKLALT
jgi:hypothetical protein